MTEHSGAAHPSTEPGAPARRSRPAHGVSERIYDYILAGRPEQPQRGTRRTQPPRPA